MSEFEIIEFCRKMIIYAALASLALFLNVLWASLRKKKKDKVLEADKNDK